MEAKWIEAESRIKQAEPGVAEAQGEELVPESGARKYGPGCCHPRSPGLDSRSARQRLFSSEDPLAALVKPILGQ